MVTGIALGTALLVGLASLYFALGRPFESLSVSLPIPVDLEVRPRVADRLPESVVRDIRGAENVTEVIPVVAAMGNVRSAQGEHGVLLIGGDCSLAQLIGRVDCAQEVTNSGSGSPVALSRPLADALGVDEGDSLTFPGNPAGQAHVGAIVEDELSDINGGFVAAATLLDAQDLAAFGPNLNSVLVRSSAPARTAGALRADLGSVAVITSPGGQSHVLLGVIRALLLFAGVVVAIAGIMIATNSFTLALDERRHPLSVTLVVGSTPTRLIASLAAEGAVLGLIGGCLAIPFGYLLARIFTSFYGQALLSGTGANLGTYYPVWIAGAAIVAGLIAGCVAAALPGLRLMREGTHIAVSEQVGILPTHKLPMWPIAFLSLIPIGIWLVRLYGEGGTSLLVGLLGLAVVLSGLLLGMFPLVPLVLKLARRLLPQSSAAGLLAVADLARDPLRLAAVVTVIGLGSGAAVATRMSRDLVAESMKRDTAILMGTRDMLTPQPLGSFGNFGFTDEALTYLSAGAERDALRFYRASDLATLGGAVTVLGVDPIDIDSVIQVENEAMAAQLGDSSLIVSTVLANRDKLRIGDPIVLPTVSGPLSFTVRGIGEPRWTPATGVGAVAVVLEDAARMHWNAPVRQVMSESPGIVMESSDGRSVAELNAATYSPDEAQNAVVTQFGLIMRPLVAIGTTLLVVAGLACANFLVLSLLQRRRLRGVLRFVGFSPTVERVSLLYQASLMALLGAAFGFVAAVIWSWCITLAAPALLALRPTFHLVGWPILFGVITSTIACLLATIPSGIEAGNLDIARAIVDE